MTVPRFAHRTSSVSRPRAAAWVALLAAPALLVGCGDSDNSSSGSAPATATASESASPADTQSAATETATESTMSTESASASEAPAASESAGASGTESAGASGTESAGATGSGAPSPFSLKLGKNTITLTGEVPDEASKTQLVQLLTAQSQGAKVVDKLEVKPGAVAPDMSYFAPISAGASAAPNDFGVAFDGKSFTLTGTAQSAAAKKQVEETFSSSFPGGKVVNKMTVG